MPKYFLGIDIGTYETKGVIVSKTGEIISQAAKKHEMIVSSLLRLQLHRPNLLRDGRVIFAT